MNELALFAGAGGGILGGLLLGWRTVCAVEIDPYARSVLLARQNDGTLAPFPIWDDIRTFDGTPWRGRVDVVSGGFPCQDIAAGSATKTGLDGERSGLWMEMQRVVGEVRPRFVYVENSSMLTSRGLGRVLGDLAALGFDARWGVFSAGDVGARHERERLFLVAYADSIVGEARPWSEQQPRQTEDGCGNSEIHACSCGEDWMAMACEIAREDDALAGRLDRTVAIGNGQVPRVAATAWRLLTGEPMNSYAARRDGETT